MRVDFCGVRGSTPAPGAEFARIGGHTSCLAISATPDGRPTLVLDAGTGIRNVSALLGGDAFQGTIALTHLHWDHVQGLPFFAAGDRDDARVLLLVPDQGSGEPAAEVLGRSMSPPHFPIGPEGLRGHWTFDTLCEGSHRIGELTVTAREIPHKGGRTYGYRVESEGASLAYMPDHRPSSSGPGDEAAHALARGVDLLVHDAQFLDTESSIAELYGHTTLSEAVDFATDAGAGELVLFHHSPGRTDDQLIGLLSEFPDDALRVSFGVEGAQRVVAPTARLTTG